MFVYFQFINKGTMKNWGSFPKKLIISAKDSDVTNLSPTWFLIKRIFMGIKLVRTCRDHASVILASHSGFYYGEKGEKMQPKPNSLHIHRQALLAKTLPDVL